MKPYIISRLSSFVALFQEIRDQKNEKDYPSKFAFKIHFTTFVPRFAITVLRRKHRRVEKKVIQAYRIEN